MGMRISGNRAVGPLGRALDSRGRRTFKAQFFLYFYVMANIAIKQCDQPAFAHVIRKRRHPFE
jgi:hypothetical protein